MAATATASSAAIHYAPEDPTLPKPWKGLVDGKTGYVYYWNPETNITQYERPASSSPPAGPSPPRKSLNSSVHVHKDSQGKHGGGGGGGSNDDDDRYDGVVNGGSTKLSSRAQTHQAVRSGSHHDRDLPNGKVDDGATKGDASSGAGSGLSIEAYRRRHEITVTGNDVPPPFISFDTTKFPVEILREVQNAGFSAPTPIQAQSWPVALQGRDIVAIAKTGSGKTLGYLIPGFLHLQRKRNNSRMGPTVLVLSPTRELATQIQVEAIKFGKSSRIACTCLYGGAPKGPQLREVDRGVDVVVATPGRLNDILEMRRIRLDQVSYLVLDEADRMLDMGFEPQIRKIVNAVPARRQTLMYTATWPKEVRKIAADLLVNPVQVNIGNVDELVANKSITQYVERVSPMEKQRRLEQILRSQEPGSKVIIFCTTKKMCNQLARNLSRQFGAAAIHGDKSQGDRDYVLNQFRSGRNLVLVATDVAARGLDIKDIRVVINYDFPTGIEDYVHRIGRTGRAGATGVAYTFFCDQDAKHASDLVKVLEGANQKVPVEIRDMASRGGGMAGGGRFNNKRQWGTAFGGGRGGDNNARGGGRGSDYNNGGRDGGGEKNRWWTSSVPSSERGGGGRGGYDRNPQPSDKFIRKPHDVADGPASVRNPFETLSRPPAEKRTRSRSRSLDKGGPLWGDKRIRARSRSPSPSNDKLDKPRDRPMRRTFHDHILPPQDPSPPHGNRQLHLPKPKEYPQRLPSPAAKQLHGGGLSSRIEDDEEEEGMIPDDE